MKEASRTHPQYAMCGLNCALCPMYHISEENHCTGCGGPGRPSCATTRCGAARGVEYCFQCGDYPCEKCLEDGPYDSFITQRNVSRDFQRAGEEGLERYLAVLAEKEALLRGLLRDYNDGRRKSFFCLAVNLLELEDVRAVAAELERTADPAAGEKERAARAVERFQDMAARRGVTLKLRRPPREPKKRP